MRYKAVLFDFDYTLGDSTGPITMGYQGGLTAMGWPAPTVEQVRPTIGHTLQDGYTMLTGDDSDDRREEFYHRFRAAVGEQAVLRGDAPMITETKLFPGTEELLTALRDAGVAAGIVSTKLGATIRTIFAYNGMEGIVSPVIGGEDVVRPKPDPQGLETALAQLGLRAEDVLFCGDTIIDARTAQAGGADFCAVLNGTTPGSAFERFPCVHIAPDLTELKEWLFAERPAEEETSMVLSFDEVGEILDELAEKLPEALFRSLNGGVLLLPEEKPDPDDSPDLYILGEYCVDEMGRYINIYYGSFAALFFDEPREVWVKELDTTLRHELTHHVEALAGERSLDVKDAAYLLHYKEEQDNDD